MLYTCDPDKYKECSKDNCFRDGGECFQTTNEEFKLEKRIHNPLAEMFDMQLGFQNRVDPRYKTTDLKERAAFLRDHFVYCDQELQEMLYEIPFIKHWKDYSKMNAVEILVAFDKAKDELIDAWHFFMNLSLGLGMEAEEFHARYMLKHKENIRRQDDGYDHTMKHI